MATTPPPLTPFGGSAPQRGDKSTFSPRFDAFITWFIAAVTQFIALAANIYANAQEAFVSAGTATSAAATAAATANVTLWVSGATVQQYAAVISPADGRTYRRTTATGAGTADPSLDTANYVLLSGQPSSMVLLGLATVSTAVTNIDFLNIFTSTYDKYVIEVENYVFSGASTLNLYLAKAGAVDSASGYYTGTAIGSLTAVGIGAGAVVSPSGTSGTGTITVRNANATSSVKDISSNGSSYNNGNSSYSSTVNAGIYLGSSNPVTGFRLTVGSSVTINAGTVRVYGIKNT